MKEVLINEEERWKQIFSMAGPVLVEAVLGTLFGMVDMMMLGNYGTSSQSAAGIAGIGVTNQFIMIGFALIQALSSGATAMIARYIGSNRKDMVDEVVRHIIILTQLFIVIPILVIGLGFTENIMKFFGAESDVIQIGMPYFRIIVIGFIFQAFNNSIFASIRGAGDTQTPMKINVFVNLLNVIGNWILIYGKFGVPEMGVKGAALSTSLAQVIASIVLLKHLLQPGGTVGINLRKRFKFHPDVVYNLIKIGMPAAGEQVMIRVGLTLFVKIIATLGTEALATHQIAINILNLSFAPGQAFGITASTLTGRSLGEERPKLAEQYIKSCRNVSIFISGIMALIFFFFGKQLATLYTGNKNVILEAGEILKLVALIQPFQSAQMTISGGLRGAGDTMTTLISALVGILFIRVILSYIFVMNLEWGLKGAWFAVLIDQFLRWAWVHLRFKTGKWKEVEIR